MSRTIRRKHSTPSWIFEDSHWDRETWQLYWTVEDPKSRVGKKRKAQYHSDRGYHWHNWRGPGWFHREYAQCPYRRDCRDQIQKYLKEEIEDVIVPDKPKREYWD